MKILIKPCLTALAFGLTHAGDLNATPPDFRIANSVVKVISQSSSWKSNLGSGVIIATDRVATNCHVTRSGQRIIVVKSGQYYPVIAQAALPEFDVCLLKTRSMPLPQAPLAEGDDLELGDDINIYGYPMALGMRVLKGAIVGLHQYNDQKVIEISAGFMQGASGGGVFNDAGKLIGLTTFMGRTQNRYHFYAIPVVWLSHALTVEFQPIKPFASTSFWESGKFEH